MEVLKTIYLKQENPRTPPVNLIPEDEWLFDFTPYLSPESEIYLLKNCLITSDGIIIKGLSAYKKNIALYEYDFINYRHKYVIKSLITHKKYFPNFSLPPILFFDNYSNGFAHWIIDTLTRLVEINDILHKHTLLLPPYIDTIPYCRQTLNFFDIKSEFILPKKSITYTKLLYMPSHIAPSGHFNINNINKLRTFILTRLSEPKSSYKNIYISREKATRRFIVNEAEVIEEMKKNGFKIIVMENYTFNQQVSIISNAENLVSIHGAALAMITFMKKDSNVLEFRKINDNHNNVFYNLACATGVNYYYQLCKGTEISKSANNFNLTVNLTSLRKNIKRLLEKSE